MWIRHKPPAHAHKVQGRSKDVIKEALLNKGSSLRYLQQRWEWRQRSISHREFNSATKDTQVDMLFGQYTIYQHKRIKQKKHFRIPKVAKKLSKIQHDYWREFKYINGELIKPNRTWVMGNEGKAKYQIDNGKVA